MVVVVQGPPALSDSLQVFHTTDPLLYNSPVLVFYGPATTVASNASRLQVHIFTPAGFESYTRLSISPSSPFYAAVTNLPREEQGDEACRAIAYALSRYFHELAPKTKECWTAQASVTKRPSSPFGLFGPTHVAVLASRLARVENGEAVIEQLQQALSEQKTTWVDVDIVLPAGTINHIPDADLELLSEDDLCRRKYGRYGPIVAALGERSFLPNPRMKRASSKPSMVGRGKTFRPGQREIIRKEMCELVDTESSYVQKLSDLCDHVSSQLKSAIADQEREEFSKECDALDKLFPSSLHGLLQHHTDLLQDLQGILDASDESAIAEIEQDSIGIPPPTNSSTLVDGMGLTMFARALVEHLPQTGPAYNEYIAAHAGFAQSMKAIFKSSHKDLASAAQQFGEQRLTSLLIEPVQRLPRYTLYIDTISKQLPIAHPALSALLKARDAVTKICVSDDAQIKSIDVEARLGRMIEQWPKCDDDPARLVTVVDVVELQTAPVLDEDECRPGVLVVFTDRIVFVNKSNPKALSARALQAEAEKPAAMEVRAGLAAHGKNLEYIDTYDLKDCIVTESFGRTAITVYDPNAGEIMPPASFRLEGSYAGGAARLSEEIVKARLEGRFTEAERQDGVWDVRCGIDQALELSTFAAVTEHSHSARCSGQLKIEIDLKQSTGAVSPRSGISAKIRLTPGGNTFCHMAVDSNHGSLNREKTALSELQTMIARRVAPILQAQLSPKESIFTPQLIARNRHILDTLEMTLATEAKTPPPSPSKSPNKLQRPMSPVKAFSGLLSGKSNIPSSQIAKKAESAFTAVPNLQPKGSSLPKPRFKENERPTSRDALSGFEPTEVALPESVNVPAVSGKRLEDKLSTYLLALQARKGNVVGRIIRARTNLDDAQVNDLYNALLENPNLMVLAAQAPVDVLFAAFEKFLNVAWKDQQGPVLEQKLLEQIQMEAVTLAPADFRIFFADCFQRMPTHNQRALKGIVRLLGELLDGTGNDGDRGMLTAAFVELLVQDEDPIPFIPMMDRFIDESEALFDDVLQVRENPATPSGSWGHSRSKSATTVLMTGNSSLRRKFGFTTGLGRENSKSEHESKVGSVWRSLSKNKQGGEFQAHRAMVQRTKSIDADSRLQYLAPAPQVSSASLGSFDFEKSPSSQDSALVPGSPLATIGEGPGTPLNASARKKRRSSLSDLTILQSPRTTPARPNLRPGGDSLNKTPSRIASPGGITPLRTPQRSRLPSSFRKENSPIGKDATMAPGPLNSGKRDEVTVTTHGTSKPSTVAMRPAVSDSTAISTPTRIGLSERASGNAMKIRPSPLTKPSTSIPTPTRRLRVQSPTKLRERLQSEQAELQKTSSTLQDELSKISEEMSKSTVPGRMGSVRLNAQTSLALAKKVEDLSALVSTTLSGLTERNTSLADDTLHALAQSELRTKKLDELYREANAENEALYKRFNDELGKVMRHVKAGDGVEELKRRLKEGEEEMEGLRRERARLKREVVGLRGRLGE